MPQPGPSPQKKWPRWRKPLALTVKAGLAVAVLTCLAQWMTRSGGAPKPIVASAAIDDPVTTGSLSPRAGAVSAGAASLDQRALKALVSEAGRDTPGPTRPARR